MKKLVTGVAVGLIIGTITTSAFAGTAMQILTYLCNFKVMVNGQKLNTNGEPILVYNGRTYVPIRYVGEALGKDVTWDAQNGVAGINDKKPVSNPNLPAPISEDSLKSNVQRLTMEMFKKEVQKYNIELDVYNRFEQSGLFVIKSDIETLPVNSPTRIEYDKQFNTYMKQPNLTYVEVLKYATQFAAPVAMREFPAPPPAIAPDRDSPLQNEGVIAIDFICREKGKDEALNEIKTNGYFLMVSDVFYMDDTSPIKIQFLNMYNPNALDMIKMYQEATQSVIPLFY